jgi:uroporphyrinogen decarboxylase
MPEMTKRERLMCALSREEPDRVPIYDLVDHVGVISKLAGEAVTLENSRQVIPAALGKVLDTTRVWFPEPVGQRTDPRGFVYERKDWWNEWMIGKPYHDRAGLIQYIHSDIDQLENWRPTHGAYTLDETRMWQKKFGDTVIPASMAAEALTDIAILIGIDEFAFLEIDEPQLVRRWMDAHHQRTMRKLQAEADCASISPIAWVFADCAFKNHLMFSKAFLTNHGFFNRLADIMGSMHSFGLKVIFHSDGDIAPIVPNLIAAGADALAPIDTAAGMDLAKLKEQYGNRVSFCGGIDIGLINSGTPDEVRQATLQAIQSAGRGGGFILGSSSEELYETLPGENILAMWETTLEFGRYPITT